MRRQRRWLAALGGLALAAGSIQDARAAIAESLPRLPANATVLAFGDSLTYGIGGLEGYPQRLAQRIDRRVINAGSNGEITAEGRRRLGSELQRTRPDLLILCLGINDFYRRVDEADIEAHLLAMLDTARRAGVPTLLLALPRPGEHGAAPLFERVADAGGAALDRESMVAVLGDPRLKADLVHANDEGYREIARRIARTLHALGAL